jgi:hypothetical protein
MRIEIRHNSTAAKERREENNVVDMAKEMIAAYGPGAWDKCIDFAGWVGSEGMPSTGDGARFWQAVAREIKILQSMGGE